MQKAALEPRPPQTTREWLKEQQNRILNCEDISTVEDIERADTLVCVGEEIHDCKDIHVAVLVRRELIFAYNERLARNVPTLQQLIYEHACISRRR